jgi:hypothetical protein
LETLIVKTAVASALIQATALFLSCQIPFYNNIFQATENDGWISFGEDFPSSSLKRLFVPNPNASSIMLGKKTIITGTPGIGKSLFLIYLLWKLVKEGK